MTTTTTTSGGDVQVKSERPLRAKHPVPGWVSVAVLTGCLLGGAWLLWWFVAGSAPRERTVTLKEVPRQARRGSGGPNMFQTLVQTSTGVLVVKGDEWHVRAAGSAVMRVLKRSAGGFDVNFYYDRNDLVSPEELALLTFRAQVANSDNAARAASVTPQQLETFQKLQSQTGMLISPAERLEMTELWEQYAASSSAESKSAAEAAMVERLETIGKKNLEPTKQQMSSRAAYVKSLLTADQLKRVQQPPQRRWRP